MVTMKFSETDFFQLFASCILTKGYAKSAIHDLDRGKSYAIPNEFYDILIDRNGFSVLELASMLPDGFNDIVTFLLSNSLGIIIDIADIGQFPRMNLEYLNPFKITNVIIDVENDLTHLKKFLQNCPFKIIPSLQLRVFNKNMKIEELYPILAEIETKEINSLELYISHNAFQNADDFLLLNSLTKLDILMVYGVEKKMEHPNLRYAIFFITSNLVGCKDCGKISHEQFAINIKTFSEAQRFNTCLNSKLSIDINGDIKNCPSMLQSFGNIQVDELSEIVESESFKKLWYSSKDQIDVCRDCEFRYICSDCRAYLEQPENPLSKPLKCGYDPYKGIWEEWSEHPLKQAAIDYYGFKGRSVR